MGIFKDLVNKLLRKKEEDKLTSSQLADQLKNADLDYKFAQLFTHAGGYFTYCEDEAEALQELNSILKLEGVSSVFCCDEDLKKFLDVISIKHTENLELINDCAFITCEYLIAYDGRIMLSANNIKSFPRASLPDRIIVMANVSQIVANLHDAMTKVKRRGSLKNLTSISGNISELDSNKQDNTKLFLLLLED